VSRYVCQACGHSIVEPPSDDYGIVAGYMRRHDAGHIQRHEHHGWMRMGTYSTPSRRRPFIAWTVLGLMALTLAVALIVAMAGGAR